MAVIRAFRHEVKGHGTRHSTDVDCLYFEFRDLDGAKILQLSTLGSDQRQSQPKVSQTFQIGSQGAAELREILDQTFPVDGTRAAGPRASVPGRPSSAEPEDPIDRFIARAGLERAEELSTGESSARRRVLAHDDRPLIGGSWCLVDLTHVPALRSSDVVHSSASPPGCRHVVLFVNDASDDLREELARHHTDVVRLADLGLSVEALAPLRRGPTIPWVEGLFGSELYVAQKSMAGRASPRDDDVRDIVSALIRLGSTAPIPLVEREAGLRHGSLRPTVPFLRRVLNVDGYDTLTLADEILSLDESLLRDQFGLSSPTVHEGALP